MNRINHDTLIKLVAVPQFSGTFATNLERAVAAAAASPAVRPQEFLSPLRVNFRTTKAFFRTELALRNDNNAEGERLRHRFDR